MTTMAKDAYLCTSILQFMYRQCINVMCYKKNFASDYSFASSPISTTPGNII